MSLKLKAISGIKITGLSKILIALIQIIQVSILARYLNMVDFGLMAIIMVVIGFAQLFADMGISNGIIYRQKVSEVQLSSLYWLNIIVSLFLFIFILISTPFIALFYNDEGLEVLISITSIVIIIQAFGQQFQILLQKELQFHTLAILELVSKFSGMIVAIVLAMLDYGIYALVYATIFSVFIKTLLLLYYGLRYHHPLFIFNFSETKFFINFGLYQMGERLLYYFNTQIDVLIIGKLLGNETLGLYSLAKQFVMRPAGIFTPVLGKVMFPIMSKVQDDVDALSKIYLKVINFLSSFIFPLYALIILFPFEIVQVFFGEKWIEMVPLLQILGLFAAIRAVSNFTGPLVLATGSVKRSFYWNLVNISIMPIVLYFSSSFGIYYVAFALVILQICLFIPNWKFIIYPLSNIEFSSYALVTIKPLLLTTFVGISIFTFFSIFNFYGKEGVGFILFILFILFTYKVFNSTFLSILVESLFAKKIKI